MEKSNVIWTAIEAIKATGGVCSSDSWTAGGLSIDTRTIQKDDLFVALVGENGDGHDYVEAAIKGGACAAIVTRKIEGVSDDKLLICLLYTSPSPRDGLLSRMPSSA